MTHKLLSDGELLCPLCGGNYLHHGRVAVYHREREDAERIRETRVVGAVAFSTTTTAGQSRCPSDRRSGIGIIFWCQLCRGNSELTFVQHKGRTLVAWRDCDVKGEGRLIRSLQEALRGVDDASGVQL
jgi:hypothetical protein